MMHPSGRVGKLKWKIARGHRVIIAVIRLNDRLRRHSQMIVCPECGCDCAGVLSPGQNSVTCVTCDRPVYIVRDPRDMTIGYGAISNSTLLDVPDDVLVHPIVDQSPIDASPRNMIIEFADGNACVIARCSNPSRTTRKSLEKTAFVLNRSVLDARLPVELMAYIRSTHNHHDGG